MQKMKLTDEWERIYDDEILDFIQGRTLGLEGIMEKALDSKFKVEIKRADGADGGCFWMAWGYDYREETTLIHLVEEDFCQIFESDYYPPETGTGNVDEYSLRGHSRKDFLWEV